MVMINLINNPTVIPETYIQFPDMLPPSLVYGGLWNAVFDDEGIFFRTSGGEALPFEGGIQESQNLSHSHYLNRNKGGSSGGDNAYVRAGKNGGSVWGASSQAHTNAEGGDEARPRNRTYRIWKRVI